MQTAVHSAESLWSRHKRPIEPKSPQSVKLRNQIVAANRGLVREEAHRWRGQCSEPFEDLVQEGYFGLIKAVERFDPSTGNAFSSFAMPYIRGAIQHYLRDKGWGVVRPPRRVIEKCAEVQNDVAIAAKHGRVMVVDEVAELKGISRQKWQAMKDMRVRKPTLELDEGIHPVSHDNPEDLLERESQRRWLYSRLEHVTEPQRSCVLERFFADLDIEEIAKRHHVSPQTAQLWIDQGLNQMRNQA